MHGKKPNIIVQENVKKENKCEWKAKKKLLKRKTVEGEIEESVKS